MKKLLSIILAVLMLSSILSMFAIPTAAEGEAAETGKVLKMYLSDAGDDANDGLTADKPMKGIKTVVNYLKTIVAPGKEYTSAEIILVGDCTISSSTQLGSHPNFAITITSADKENARLLLKHNFRIGGETLFTGLKMLRMNNNTAQVLWADGNKLTIGKEGVKNDVVTYDANSGFPALSVTGGSPKVLKDKSVDVTINSGTYLYLNTATGTYGDQLNGDVNFVINDATVIGGYIGLIGGFDGANYKLAGGTILRSTSVIKDYNIVINGGTFTNTDIVVGAVSADEAENKVEGNTVIDINGGTFTNCKIGMGETLVADGLGTYNFEKGVKVDLTDIPNADKSKYTSLVVAGDVAATLTKNKITIVEHELKNFEDTNDTQHKAYCACGCGQNEMQNHSYDAGEVTTQPSHSAEGEKTYTCAVCNGTKLEKIDPDATTHNYTTGWVKVDDTNHKKTCDDPNCPDTAKGLVTEAHTWDEGKVTKEATHTEEGEKTFTCSVCNGTKVEAIKKTDIHSMGDWVKHDANQHKRECACGEAKYADHTWDAGKVTKQATADAEGEKTYTCSVCGETKTEAVAKLAAETEAEEKGGCGSVVGIGVVAIVAASAAVAFIPKKKED